MNRDSVGSTKIYSNNEQANKQIQVVAALVASGKSDAEIAERLIQYKTVNLISGKVAWTLNDIQQIRTAHRLAADGMKLCPTCSKQIKHDTLICDYCGVQVPSPSPHPYAIASTTAGTERRQEQESPKELEPTHPAYDAFVTKASVDQRRKRKKRIILLTVGGLIALSMLILRISPSSGPGRLEPISARIAKDDLATAEQRLNEVTNANYAKDVEPLKRQIDCKKAGLGRMKEMVAGSVPDIEVIRFVNECLEYIPGLRAILVNHVSSIQVRGCDIRIGDSSDLFNIFTGRDMYHGIFYDLLAPDPDPLLHQRNRKIHVYHVEGQYFSLEFRRQTEVDPYRLTDIGLLANGYRSWTGVDAEEEARVARVAQVPLESGQMHDVEMAVRKCKAGGYREGGRSAEMGADPRMIFRVGAHIESGELSNLFDTHFPNAKYFPNQTVQVISENKPWLIQVQKLNDTGIPAIYEIVSVSPQ